MTRQTTSLDALRPGSGGRILDIQGDGAVKQRLMEMGLVTETEVQVVRTAPLGDPIEVEVMGYQLSLRKSEAAAVRVEVDA